MADNLNVRLELEDHGHLDISKEIPLAITFDINDVRNISSRNGAWSKTIKLPGTNHNNNVLGSIFDVNIQALTFNPQIKENVRISVDGLDSFEGIFQIRKINKNYKNSEDMGITYDAYIKNDTSSFYNDISGLYLDELDLSEFDHTWDIGTVDTSMASGTWSDGYQYYLSYNPNVDAFYEPRDLIPAVYAKTYWDKIFDAAGFTYEWDEMWDLNFHKLIIPYNGDGYKPFSDDAFKFRAGINASTQYLLVHSEWGLLNPTNATNVITAYADLPLIYNDDDNSVENWRDPNSLYNTSNGRFDVSNYTGSMEFTIKFTADVGINLVQDSGSSGTATSFIPYRLLDTTRFTDTGVSFTYDFVHTVEVYDSGGTWLGNISSEVVSSITATGLGAGPFSAGYNFIEQINPEITCVYSAAQFPTAAYIQLELKGTATTGPVTQFAGYGGTPYGPPNIGPVDAYNADFLLDFVPQNDSFGHYTNTPDVYLIDAAPVSMNSLIPKKTKQSDFILAITKMFNLYIKEDRYDPTNLIIKTRDTFYADGAELDWSELLDVRSVDVEILSNTQKKRKIFTYKDDDKDEVLKAYNEETNETYGELEYIFENEFIKAVDRVEPIFSPTVITTGPGLGAPNRVPFIDSRAPMNNLRILYTGDVLNGYWEYFTGINLPGNFTPKSAYRYAGHLYPNPTNPTEDLNFGICEYYAHPYATMTDNNLYNRFYSQQMNIFDTGHILTAKFNLSYPEVSELQMDERIFVHDSWWHINKIFDFDLNGRKTTKVELITADPSGGNFVANDNVVITTSRPNRVFEKLNASTLEDSSRNVFGAGTTYVMPLGNGNVIQGGASKGFVAGDNNQAQGKNFLITGNDNQVREDNITAIGVDGATFDEPGGRVYSTTLVRFSNFISAGRDDVLGKFPDNKVVNSLDGGRDDIRPLGGYSIETNVEAGRDAILYGK